MSKVISIQYIVSLLPDALLGSAIVHWKKLLAQKKMKIFLWELYWIYRQFTARRTVDAIFNHARLEYGVGVGMFHVYPH